TIMLDTGWHDVALNLNQVGSPARADLSITDGPELVGQHLPRSRLRPVEPRIARVVASGDKGSHTITDNNPGSPGVGNASTDGAVTETITQVDVLVHVNTPRLSDLVFDLKNTSNMTLNLQTHGGGAATGDQFLYFVLTPAQAAQFLMTPVTGNWSMTVKD